MALQWRHNGSDGVPNHQPHHCLLNRLFGCKSKKTSKPRVTGLIAGNSPGTGEFPAQMASNAENFSIWWRHHGLVYVSPSINMLIDLASWHYSDVTMRAMASQIIGISIIYSTVCSGTDQKEHQKLRTTGLCERNSPVTGEFPAQMASSLEYVSIPWRHHETLSTLVQVIAYRQFHTKPLTGLLLTYCQWDT